MIWLYLIHAGVSALLFAGMFLVAASAGPLGELRSFVALAVFAFLWFVESLWRRLVR